MNKKYENSIPNYFRPSWFRSRLKSLVRSPNNVKEKIRKEKTDTKTQSRGRSLTTSVSLGLRTCNRQKHSSSEEERNGGMEDEAEIPVDQSRAVHLHHGPSYRLGKGSFLPPCKLQSFFFLVSSILSDSITLGIRKLRYLPPSLLARPGTWTLLKRGAPPFSI